MNSPPPLPPLSPTDSVLLLRLFALSESYTALAAELATDAFNHLGPNRPKHILDLYAWASSPSIAPWIAFHRAATDNQRRTLALNTLESVIKSTDSPTERRRAASTLLRALNGVWRIQNPQSKIQNPRSRRSRRSRRSCRSYSPPPPPISGPVPGADQHAELQLIRAAFNTPQPSVVLSTLHEHAAPNAFFAAQPVHQDKAEWIASAPHTFPAGFRFPLWLSECKETERTDRHSRWTLWAANPDNTSFRCTLSLIKNPDRQGGARDDAPDDCWRLATFDILSRSG